MRLSARRASAAFLLLLPLAAAPVSATAATGGAEPRPTASRAEPAPLLTHAAGGIEGQYIVTLREGAAPAAKVAGVAGVTPLFSYESVLHGFAARLTPDQLSAVRAMPEVEAVEQDAVVTATPVAAERPAPRAPASSWGLDRIDQPYLPLDNQFNVQGTGAGVWALILDTGIDYSHPEFANRAYFGFDAIGDGRNGQDCNGHGTHVAGTVAGATFGVARQAKVVSFRVLDCEGKGAYSGMIAGFDRAAASNARPAVLNGSLGGPRSDAVNAAADNLFAKGVLPVLAAGNSAEDACKVSPASTPRAVTVGASDHQDREASFSNFGPCLDLYAPGTQIRSARLGGGSTTLDGTSMASPHVAGVATLYKARNPGASPAEVTDWLLQQSVSGALTVSKGSPNRLVQTGGL
ncbi:S8 family peptidase [Streptomyces sp. DH12]|uniref:S8 family peptidase n=1 Tax=Streptomyces sp. DH12 TaxID=2857010 RepID=UPI001E385265|nr:S8 family peptidase [Streptomyces sp. DH12]